MKREELLTFLAGAIVQRKRQDRPLKVGIDGRCASGKTVLADELASILTERNVEVLRPSVDGFHHPREMRYRQGEYSAIGYYEDAYDYQAVIDSLLGPLSGNVFPVRCRQVAPDLRQPVPANDLPTAARPVVVSARAVLLFEGLFLFRRELNAWWDYRILVDIDSATSLRRAIKRDTGVIGPADVVQRKYQLRYEPAWQIYLEREHPEAKADIVVDNRDFFNPLLTCCRPQNA